MNAKHSWLYDLPDSEAMLHIMNGYRCKLKGDTNFPNVAKYRIKIIRITFKKLTDGKEDNNPKEETGA